MGGESESKNICQTRATKRICVTEKERKQSGRQPEVPALESNKQPKNSKVSKPKHTVKLHPVSEAKEPQS